MAGLLLAGVLLSLVLGSMPVQAQITAEPEILSVMLAPGDSAERTVMLTNTGSESVSFCLNFDRPLQRLAGAVLRLSEDAAGAACGALGEILFYVDEEDFGAGWSPYGLTMTSAGRLFAADQGLNRRTHELTPELEVVRSFEHPVVAEVSTFPATKGLAYDPASEMLWWLNIEEQGQDFRRAMLLEGTLDGEPTGRRITIPSLSPDEDETVSPSRLSYDPATRRFFLTGFNRTTGETTLWAFDTTGRVADGYPVRQMARPGGIAVGPDAYGGWDPDGGPGGAGAPGEAEAVRLEVVTASPSGGLSDCLDVVDVWGGGLGIATPLPELGGGPDLSSPVGEPLRSRVDPNGVVYYPFIIFFETEGIVGIRPHPLPPSWLSVSEWNGTLGPGESVEVMLTFSSGTRVIGNTYTAALQVFEAETGAELEVPLSFEVAPKTDAEDTAELPESSLVVFPNPALRQAAVQVEVPERADLRVVVYDVLGRRVALLHDGPVEAGRHRFDLNAAMPGGVYVVHATGGAFTASQRFVLVR